MTAVSVAARGQRGSQGALKRRLSSILFIALPINVQGQCHASATSENKGQAFGTITSGGPDGVTVKQTVLSKRGMACRAFVLKDTSVTHRLIKRTAETAHSTAAGLNCKSMRATTQWRMSSRSQEPTICAIVNRTDAVPHNS